MAIENSKVQVGALRQSVDNDLSQAYEAALGRLGGDVYTLLFGKSSKGSLHLVMLEEFQQISAGHSSPAFASAQQGGVVDGKVAEREVDAHISLRLLAYNLEQGLK